MEPFLTLPTNTGQLFDLLRIRLSHIPRLVSIGRQTAPICVRVTIPNKEIASVYKSEILSHFLQKGIITRTTANKIAESLYANDHKKLQSAVAEYLDKSISFYDGGAEGFYHGLMLGLIALMDNQYKIKSNRESGDGRYDICMIPREKRYPGILFELKWEKESGRRGS